MSSYNTTVTILIITFLALLGIFIYDRIDINHIKQSNYNVLSSFCPIGLTDVSIYDVNFCQGKPFVCSKETNDNYNCYYINVSINELK